MSVLVRSSSAVRSYFLEDPSSPSFPLAIPLLCYRELRQRIYLSAFLITERTHPTVRMFHSLRHSITIAFDGAGIFNLLPITYAFQPRLRVRLTQGRRALPWKPWAFGEGDSHSLCRLLMPCILTSFRFSTPHGIPSTQKLRSPTA